MTKLEVIREYNDLLACGVVRGGVSRYSDETSIRVGIIDFCDFLHRDGFISDRQAYNWTFTVRKDLSGLCLR